MNLFNLEQIEEATLAGDVVISGNQSVAPILKTVSPAGQSIDVVNDFKWTKTLKEGRADVPTLLLKEMTVTRSSFIGNLQYAANVFVDASQNALDALKDVKLPEFVGKYVNRDTIEKASDNLNRVAREKFRTGLGKYELKNRHLNPYFNLYGTELTNFRYRLPYIVEDWKATQSEWGDGIFAGAAATLFSFASYIEEGFSMESAKSYTYPKTGPSRSFRFFLDNTRDISDGEDSSWNKNWQFVFMLTYSQLPNRKSRFQSIPPSVYEANIPGLLYYPYSYISSMEVVNHGVRKSKQVTYLLNGEQKTAQTIIPEAYEVKINLQSMLAETQNLYFESLRPGAKIRLEERFEN